MEETSSNAIAHDDVLVESINHHERLGSRNDLVPYHSEANASMMPTTDTVSEQGYDVFTHQVAQTTHRYLMNPESVLEEGCRNCPEN